MSRYVDIETIKPKQYENSEVELGVLAYDYDEVDAMPFIDIVRCGECKFSEVIQNDSSGVMARYCRAFTVPMMKSDDDFCSYGCRDSEKPNNSKERSSE